MASTITDDRISVFRSVRTQRISEAIVQQIQEAIFSRKWRPGEKLPPEKELARKFQASRGTVREAIRALELSGLVTVRPGVGGGIVVVEPTFQLVTSSMQTLLRANKLSAREIFAARHILEPVIAEVAAIKSDAEDIRRLEDSLEDFKRLARAGEIRRGDGVKFHFEVAMACKTQLLPLLVSSLFAVEEATERGGPTCETDVRSIMHEHEAILDAIRDHNSPRARQLMTEHLSHTEELLARIDDGIQNGPAEVESILR